MITPDAFFDYVQKAGGALSVVFLALGYYIVKAIRKGEIIIIPAFVYAEARAREEKLTKLLEAQSEAHQVTIDIADNLRKINAEQTNVITTQAQIIGHRLEGK